MTSKERVQNAFAHKISDKVPVDFGGMGCTMINAMIMKELREYFGLEKNLPKISDMGTMAAFMEPDLAECMGCDVFQLNGYGDSFGHSNVAWKEWNYRGIDVLIPANCEIRDDGKEGYYVFPQGDASCVPSGHMPAGGYYFDALVRTDEFDEDTADPKDNAEDYGAVSQEQINYHRNLLNNIKDYQKAIQVSPAYMALGDAFNIPGQNLKNPKGIRDISEWYMAPLLYPDYVCDVFEIGVEQSIANLKKYWDEFGNQIDVVQTCGTDFGSQRGLMMSLDTFEEIYMPYYKMLNSWIHENTTWKILKHSCGGIYDLIPCFIECGFDAINPVQCSAEGMEPQRLKQTYGKDILFWGGGVDTQKTLPFGTPQEVYKEVLERMEIFSKEGGFIFATIHNIQANTPVKNIVAMLDAIKAYNGER